MIVVDTSPFFHGPMLATLDRTDELLLVCSLDVPTLKNVRLALQTLELLSFPSERIRLVLNRANSKVGMKPGEVESALEVKVRFSIPSDRAVPIAVNRGNPAVLADARADFSRAVRDMARRSSRSNPLRPRPESRGRTQGRRRWFGKAAYAWVSRTASTGRNGNGSNGDEGPEPLTRSGRRLPSAPKTAATASIRTRS